MEVEKRSLKLKALTMSSLLSVLSVIFYITTQVPLLNIIGMIACPVPIIQIAVEFGWKYSLLSSAVSTFLVTIILGPVQGYFYLSLFAVMGVVIGALSLKKLNASELVIYGTVVILVLNLFFYYGIERLLGLEDFLKQGSQMAEKFIKEIFEFSGENTDKTVAGESLKDLRLMYESSLRKIFGFPLALFAVLSFSLFYVYYLITQFWFMKIKKPFRQMPPPFFWRPTPVLAYFTIGSGMITLIADYFGNPTIMRASFNLFCVFYFFMFFLSVSLVNFFMIQYRAGFLIRLLFMVTFLPLNLLGWVMPFPVNLIPILPSLIDSFKNFRNLVPLSEVPCEVA